MGQSTALTLVRTLLGLTIVWMALTAFAMEQSRRLPSDDLTDATRIAILTERLTVAQSLSEIQIKLGGVKQTADDARQEIRDIRNALYGIVGTLVGSILLQLVQFRKTRQTAS